jgi:uncharacterized membrane protein
VVFTNETDMFSSVLVQILLFFTYFFNFFLYVLLQCGLKKNATNYSNTDIQMSEFLTRQTYVLTNKANIKIMMGNHDVPVSMRNTPKGRIRDTDSNISQTC